MALASAAFTVAGCWGAGVWLIARTGAKLTRAEKFPLALVTGASLVHLFVFAAMALHVAFKPVWVIGLAALIAVGVRGSRSGEAVKAPGDRLKPVPRVLFSAIFAVFTVYYLANAWAPEISPDGSGYHLEIIAGYLHAHKFFRVPTNMYAALGQGVELVYAPAFALGRHSAAALVHFAFLIALAMLIAAYGRRIGKPPAGAAAALLVYLSPVVGLDGTTAYIDVAAAAIAFSLFYWLEIWDGSRDARLLAPIGLLAGYAYAAKYTGFVLVPFAMGFILWRTRRWKPALLVGAIAAVMIVPWMVKDWIWFRDPVAPFLSDVFPSPYLHPITIQGWSEFLRRYNLPNLWTLPLQVTVVGKTQGIIGPVFLLAPLGLLALRDRAGRRLLAIGLVLLATYFANVGTRFLIPSLPFFALALAIALARPAMVLIGVVALHAVASWPAVLPRYSDPYLWRLIEFPWRAALGIDSREKFLQTHSFRYDLVHMMNSEVPAGDRILSFSGVPTAYLKPVLMQSLQAAPNSALIDFLNVALYPQWQPTRALVFRFAERPMRRVRLLETARGHGLEQWNVHELRFFDRGVEIPRAPQWRLRANPNPWDVQLAFDNSPVTRWRSWQTPAPGMFIEVDFGRDQNVDEVRMETSADYAWPIQLRVETMNAGAWTAITDRFVEQAIEYHGSMRRAATYELAVRGIHYFLIKDDDWGAADFKDDPVAWGMRVVGFAAGGTLFRIDLKDVAP